MNDTLKVAGRIGAELGAAKAENDRLREALSRIANLPMYQCSTENDYRLSAAKAMAVGALTHQADPAETTEAYTARDMATAAAQGFRDGQAAVEPAPAQDELPAGGVTIEKDIFGTVHIKMGDFDYIQIQYQYPYTDNASQNVLAKRIAELLTRPAQTEQQPIRMPERKRTEHLPKEYKTMTVVRAGLEAYNRALDDVAALNATPIAQTAPQGKFRMGDRVKKTGGSEWVGHVCGTYSTALTPEGYAVESEAHAGSVQIYPAKALEAVE